MKKLTSSLLPGLLVFCTCLLLLLVSYWNSIQIRETADSAKKIESIISTTVSQAPRTQEIFVNSFFDYSGDPFIGTQEAENILIIFTDYQCPYCTDFYLESLVPLIDIYSSRYGLKIVFKNFPLPDIHDKAYSAAIMAEWAAETGKFESFQKAITSNFETFMLEEYEIWAESKGLNLRNFLSKKTQNRLTKMVDTDVQEALSAGIQVTPSLIFRGRIIPGSLSLQKLIVMLSENLPKNDMDLNPLSAAKNLSDYIIIDLRDTEEFSNTHIPGGVNIPWNSKSFFSDLEHLDKSKPLILYCNRGITSSDACLVLKSLGRDNVFSLTNGFYYWTALKLSTE